jgi:DNA-binding HxlR family transcriptional regulator
LPFGYGAIVNMAASPKSGAMGAGLLSYTVTMMRYGQFCPIAKAAEIVAERWTPLVVHELLAGSTHFSEIRRGVPLMSQTLLSQRLKDLERAGIVERRGDDPRRREWHLTKAGLALAPVIHQLGEWGLQFAQDPLEENDLDVTVLMWNIRRRVDPTVFGGGRVTVHFDFEDVPQGKRRWWVVNDRGNVDLCPTDPGFPVDVYIMTDVRTMIRIWFAKMSIEAAVRSDQMEIVAPPKLRSRLRSWLLLSPINMATLSKPVPVSALNDKPRSPRAGRQT